MSSPVLLVTPQNTSYDGVRSWQEHHSSDAGSPRGLVSGEPRDLPHHGGCEPGHLRMPVEFLQFKVTIFLFAMRVSSALKRKGTLLPVTAGTCPEDMSDTSTRVTQALNDRCRRMHAGTPCTRSPGSVRLTDRESRQ